MKHEQPSPPPGFWRSGSGFAICILLGIAGLFLILEHRAHAAEWLPYLLLLACPLMHVFMHRGHGGHAAARQPVRDAASEPHEASAPDRHESAK